MRRLALTVLLVLLGAAVAAPAFAAPRHGTAHRIAHQAAKACRAERAALGGEAFEEKYANANGRHAFRRCVRSTIQEIARELRAAVGACRAERAELGVEAFREKYANENGKRAFRICVRSNLSASGDAAAA